jgi:type IV pilus assembly protein PilC
MRDAETGLGMPHTGKNGTLHSELKPQNSEPNTQNFTLMPSYSYAAIDGANGRERTGILDSADVETAIAELKTRGLYPTAVTPDVAAPSPKQEAGPADSFLASVIRRFRKTAGDRELTVFTCQLSALVGAGMPLVRSLDLLAKQERNPAWRQTIIGLADTIRTGGTLSDGLSRLARIFDRLYLGMVRAGEAGGSLGVVLERLARHMEKAGRVKARVKAALTYPLVIMAVATVIVVLLMALVVPRFEAIFAGVLKGAPLPALTQGVLGAGRFVGRSWPVAAVVVIALGAGQRWLRRTALGARFFAQLSLRVPLLGGLVLKSAVARFARTLGTMLASGVSILEALRLARETCGNRVVAEAIDTIHRRVREGEGIALPLAATGIFPPLVAGMVSVGEETGSLPAMLLRVADMYEEEVDNAVTSLTSLLEPAMIVLMAVVVGTIVIALFLPIIRIVQMLG